MEEKFKRQIAFKIKIKEITLGTPFFDKERFSFLEIRNRKISRVNLIGNIVDRYESEGEKKYLFFTLDDGSGQMRLKIFGDDVQKFKEFSQGDTVLIIGKIRNWNNDFYVQPEIMKTKDPKHLLIRKLEFEKESPTISSDSYKPREAKPLISSENSSKSEDKILDNNRDYIKTIRERLINKIKLSEDSEGIEKEKIILELTDIPPEIIEKEIQQLLENGIIFEPRPQRLKYLG